jgi:CO/xanthine dehydrogenase Mo-binding subunit
MAGEMSNGAVAPAIANAIADAIGIRVTSLPLSAERIHGLLRDRGA